jgi:hypothetical protein
MSHGCGRVLRYRIQAANPPAKSSIRGVVMSTRTWFVLLAATLSCGTASCSSRSPEAPDVEKAFADYREALINQKGTAAVDLIAPATIAEYQKYRDLALKGDEQTVKGLSITARTNVLMMRHRVGKDLLKTMDGRKALAYAVDQNWIGKEGVQKAGVTDVDVSGSNATAKVTVNGQKSNEKFHFVKHDGKWTIDLVQNFPQADTMFRKMAADAEMGENEFLFEILSMLSSRPVTDAIWQPLE